MVVNQNLECEFLLRREIAHLTDEFKGIFGAETVERFVRESLDELGGSVGDIVREKLAVLEGQRQQLQRERAQVAGQQAIWRAAYDRVAELERWCRSVAANLGGMTYQQKRLALEALD